MIVDVSKVPEHGTTFLLSHYWLLQFGDDFVQNAPIWTLVPLTIPSPRWLWLWKAVVPRTGGSWIGLRCVSSLNYSTWSSQLVWVENAHNSMTSSATGKKEERRKKECLPSRPPWDTNPRCCLSRKGNSLPFNPESRASLLPPLEIQILRSVEQNKRLADCHVSVPTYQADQKVWLSTKNVPLRTKSKK